MPNREEENRANLKNDVLENSNNNESDRSRDNNREGGEVQDVFGDQPLLMVTMFVLLLQILNYVMRPPCTC